ncbi:hypothetical protein V8E55_000613 [Tylopilus felleus]
MTSNLAGSFAPYTPPPDDPAHLSSEPVSRPRIWFSHSIASYQSGGLPSSTVVSQTAAASTDIERGQHNEWETTYGLRVDLLAAFAYLLGPISGSTVSLFSARACISTPTALALLILEVHNDYMTASSIPVGALDDSSTCRVHLCPDTTISIVDMFFSGIGPLCLSICNGAFLGAYGGDLSRYRLPKIGSLADQWVDEE